MLFQQTWKKVLQKCNVRFTGKPIYDIYVIVCVGITVYKINKAVINFDVLNVPMTLAWTLNNWNRGIWGLLNQSQIKSRQVFFTYQYSPRRKTVDLIRIILLWNIAQRLKNTSESSDEIQTRLNNKVSTGDLLDNI